MSNKRHSHKAKLPYSSKYIDVTAIALTFLTAFAATRLKGTGLDYINMQINYRGPVQWAILYAIYRNVFASILAMRTTSLPDVHFRQALAFTLLPFFFGLIGTVQGLANAIRGLGLFLAFGAGSTKEQMVDAVSKMFAGSGVALDTLYLGLLGTLICLGLHIKTLSKHIDHHSPLPEEQIDDVNVE